MRRILYQSFLAVCLLFNFIVAFSYDFYTTKVPVASRSTPDRAQAMEQALNDVLVKVSGDMNVRDNPDLEPALRQVNNMISQYQYEETEGGYLFLSVSFDEESVNHALTQAGFEVWDGFRPVNIVWAAVDVNGRRYLLTQSEERPQAVELRKALEDLAAQRGMSIIFPLGDLSDRRMVTTSDIWGGFYSQIEKASKRYNSDGIVIIKLTTLPDEKYQVDWNASLGREKENGYRMNTMLTTALADPVNGMADISANMYAKAFDQIDHATLIVTELNEVQDYAKVYAYLKQLNTVADVQLAEFEASNVVFDIKLSGRLATFEKKLSLDGLLLPSDDATLVADNSSTVIYRYTP